MLWLGVDVGGTFTDAVLFDEARQRFRHAKAPSTPEDPTAGVLAALDALKVDLTEVERLVHGVTIGTNAILEQKGAEVWMLTTEGFRDVLEIARTNRPELYNIKSLKTPPLVPRTRTLEIGERMLFDGSVLKALDLEEVRRITGKIPAGNIPGGARRNGNIAVAVCFLHSYANPAHENAAAEVVREVDQESGKGWFVCASSEVLPQFREYERFNTTALNAYIGPLMARYLARLRESLAARGYEREVFIMTSNGGVSTARRAARLPVGTVLSGPAGGVAAAVHLGGLVSGNGDDPNSNAPNGDAPQGGPGVNLITCDMGGTSTDVCLIEGLKIPVTNEQYIGAYANRTPQVEVKAVGAGGGSIAWLDDGDILNVGPRSAGAQPGPACYGQGGVEPTVTDANLLLGRLGAGNPLGGQIALDTNLAEKAIAPLAARLGLDVHALAEGIVRIAVARMVSAIKQISIANGHDPRDFMLTAYGGAGPMHAALIAEELEISRILVPPWPGTFAAFGALISEQRHDLSRTHTLQTRHADDAEIEAVFSALEAEGRALLTAEGASPESVEFQRALGMRYLGQSWELEVEVPDGARSGAALEAAFEAVHERRFGHRAGGATEIVNFKLTVLGRMPKPTLPRWEPAGNGAHSEELAEQERRPVYFGGGFDQVPVYDRERLPAGAVLDGPAIIEETGSTTVVPPGWRGTVRTLGDILMEWREA
ncbi:MAG: hydantoinase/oxoprolinase family protein [bacterium]